MNDKGNFLNRMGVAHEEFALKEVMNHKGELPQPLETRELFLEDRLAIRNCTARG